MNLSAIVPWRTAVCKPAVWDPFREMEALLGETAGFSPEVDVKESETEFVFSVSVPGVEKSDLHVDLREDRITIRGERKLDKEYENQEGVHRREQGYGSFSRSFTLPSAVDAKGAKAVHKDGVLKIRLPKTGEAKPHTLDIE